MEQVSPILVEIRVVMLLRCQVLSLLCIVVCLFVVLLGFFPKLLSVFLRPMTFDNPQVKIRYHIEGFQKYKKKCFASIILKYISVLHYWLQPALPTSYNSLPTGIHFSKLVRKINIVFPTCVLIPIKIMCCISCGSYVTIVRMSLNVY